MWLTYERAQQHYAQAQSQCDETQAEITRLLMPDSAEKPDVHDLARAEGLRLQRNLAFEELRRAEDDLVQAAIDLRCARS